MKIRTGTDIIEIERVKQSIEETNGEFCKRVYTQEEIEYCESKKIQKYQHYAARFAVKEATFKAISAGLKDKYQISWKDIEVKNVANTYYLPHVAPALQTILVAIPLQLLAYYTACLKGCDVDKPRNLAKSVTVE